MPRTQLQEARWLIRSLENTNGHAAQGGSLHRAASVRVPGKRRRVDAADLSEACGRSRARYVNHLLCYYHKYMDTHRGVFEFRYFFSSHVAANDGTERRPPRSAPRSATWWRRKMWRNRYPTAASPTSCRTRACRSRGVPCEISRGARHTAFERSQARTSEVIAKHIRITSTALFRKRPWQWDLFVIYCVADRLPEEAPWN